jgi:hypothetical protein
MTIQIIEKQGNIFRIMINGQRYDYHTPLSLFGKGIFPMPKRVKGSTLGWSIKGDWVSYNQIKGAIQY